MKTRFVASVLVAGLLVSGCVHEQPGLVLAPVGPAKAAPLAYELSGTLVVYSAFEVGPHFYDSFNKHRYSDYKIFLPDGKLFRKVHNDNETVIEGPVWVGLPPGTYRVLAWAGRREVTVPVVIASRQVTTVHLENAVNEPIAPTAAAGH